jgi:hypothetical protein
MIAAIYARKSTEPAGADEGPGRGGGLGVRR